MALDIVSHMTQTANPVTLLASPLGEEGHKVAKGWTVVILIMILDVDVTAAGGIIKLIALRAIPQPSGQRPVKLKNPPALGPVNLKNLPLVPVAMVICIGPAKGVPLLPVEELHHILGDIFLPQYGRQVALVQKCSFFRKKGIHVGGRRQLVLLILHIGLQLFHVAPKERLPLWAGGRPLEVEGEEMADFLNGHIHIPEELDEPEQGNVPVCEDTDAAYAPSYKLQQSLLVIKAERGGRNAGDVHHVLHSI